MFAWIDPFLKISTCTICQCTAHIPSGTFLLSLMGFPPKQTRIWVQVSYEGGDPRTPRAQHRSQKGEEGGRESAKVSTEHLPGRNGPRPPGALRDCTGTAQDCRPARNTDSRVRAGSVPGGVCPHHREAQPHSPPCVASTAATTQRMLREQLLSCPVAHQANSRV